MRCRDSKCVEGGDESSLLIEYSSVFVLTSRKARGEAVKPWAFLAVNEFNLTIVPLYEAARTWFQGHFAPDDSTGSMLPAGIEPAP